MATNQTNVGTSHNLLNYSGLLFNKGARDVPFSTLISGRARNVNAWSFPTSIVFNSMAATNAGGLGAASQPAITETGSLTAPDAHLVTRAQNKNYVQIFQRKIALSYAKTSSMGQLSGLNLAGVTANPADELDFQVAANMEKIAQDIEYSFLNGSGQEGTYDDIAYKMQGIIGAVSTNAADADGADLGYWMVADTIKNIRTNGGYGQLILMTHPVNILQLNADAADNGMTIAPAGIERNGLRLRVLETPFGDLPIVSNSFVPEGTALIFDPDVCAPVYLDVPGKGNFFLEELAKTGAAETYQLYGQISLDYGAEFRHGKITNLSTTFTGAKGRKIYGGVTVESDASNPLNALVVNDSESPIPTTTVTGG